MTTELALHRRGRAVALLLLAATLAAVAFITLAKQPGSSLADAGLKGPKDHGGRLLVRDCEMAPYRFLERVLGRRLHWAGHRYGLLLDLAPSFVRSSRSFTEPQYCMGSVPIGNNREFFHALL